MPTSHITSLIRFRTWQRFFIFGSGALVSLMLLIIFFTQARSAILNHIEMLRQSFISEHALLEQEIAERKNTFQNILTGIDIVLTETNGQDAMPSLRTRYITLSARTPRAYFLPEDRQQERSDISAFMHLADWVAHFMKKEDTRQKGEVLSGYLLHARHGVIDIITNKVNRDDISQVGELSKLVKEIEQTKPGVSSLRNGSLSERIVWLSPQIAPDSRTEILRLAAPVMRHDRSFATLVMAFPAPTLTSPLTLSSLQDALSIRTHTGDVVSGDKKQAITYTALKALMSTDNGRTEEYDGQGLVFIDALADTGWVLLLQCSWREVFAAVCYQIAEVAAATFALLLLIWSLLIAFKLRIFRPLIQLSRQVFDSEQLSRTLIDTAPLGLGILDVKKQQFLLSSPLMQQTDLRLHASDDRLAGKLTQSYFRQTAEPDAQQNPEMAQFEQSLRLSKTESVSLSVSMAPARYQGDDVLVVAFTDITSKKQLEQQLIAAREAADKASAAKSAFLAAMSHEIRTPLNAILGNLELLSREVPDDLRERLGIIQRASDSLLMTISDILDFSKIEAGALRIEEKDFDLLSVTTEVLAVFAPLARAKGVRLSGETGHDATPPLRGDPTAVRQILNNLLSNALKFTEKGAVTLYIHVDRVHRRVNIDVKDTGMGMTPTQLEQVFHPFRQADETISRRYGGTGLGLALCTGLVHAMSGEISAVSEVGKGSTFRVSLPLGEGIACTGLPERPRLQIQHPAGLHVLVAEDNRVNRRLFKEQLTLLGCNVTLAKNGQEALECLQRQAFDIVLTDLCMPEMNGYALARKIQHNWPALPVVAVTASTTQHEFEECERAGMCRVLTKPLLLNTLNQALLDICRPLPAEGLIPPSEPECANARFGLLGGRALPDDIRQLFEQTCTESAAHIREALRGQNMPVILRELHSLKGAFGVFAMNNLKDETSALSNAIKTGGLTEATPPLIHFCERVEARMKPSSHDES